MFSYTPSNINDLETSISPERLATYLSKTQNCKENALKLYLRNSELSAAFYFPLQGLEITFRNTLHSAMSQKFGVNWYDTAPLNHWAKTAIDTAKAKVMKDQGHVDTPHILAELPFGFWISLLNKEYHQSLWEPALGKYFANAHKSCRHIHHELNHIRILRNRVAHHEPIFARHLEQDYSTIIKIIDWMNPVKATWIDKHNQVLKTIANP